jgi:hypothetical protein
VIGLAVLPRVLAVLTVAALSACTAQVGGTPVAGTTLPDEPEELTAEAVFDDLTTIAPCSLTDPDVFAEFGDAKFGTPESLDYCAISIDTADGANVIMSIGSLGSLDALPDLNGKRVKDLEQGLWVGQQDDDESFCSQLLVFPDDITLQVQGSIYEGTANTCPMVEAGMDRVIEVVLAGDAEQRDPADDSLQTMDPCETIDDSQVAAISGLTGAARPSEYPGKHTCYWEVPNASTRVSVRLVFGAGVKPTVYQTGGNTNPIVGRPSVTNPYPSLGDGSYCAVETAHIPFDEIEGEDTVELAQVYVRMPAGQVEAGCAAALAVATIVWPELPAV